MVLALEQRKIDEFSTGTPIPEAAIARGFGVMIVDNAAGEDPDFAEFMMNSVMVHPDYARQNPEVVRKVIRASSGASTTRSSPTASRRPGSASPATAGSPSVPWS